MVYCPSIFWSFFGLTKSGVRSYIWMEELAGETLVRHLEFSTFVFIVVHLEGHVIAARLRMWIVLMISCLLLLVVIGLIVLGLGDSLLVTPSRCSLALFFSVISFLFLVSCFLFPVFSFLFVYLSTTLCCSCIM